ncbi:prealbumin-like fold domain-containing protein, partial [Bacillus sp. D-CC]
VKSVRTSLLFTSTILNTAPARGFLSPNSSTFNNSTSPVFKLLVAVTVKDLEPGTYKFIETEAPKDYVLNTKPIEFTIDKSQQSFATVTATNSLKTGEVELLKVDEFGDKK